MRLLALLILATFARPALCDQSFEVTGRPPFEWPGTAQDTARANRLEKAKIESFINSFDPRRDGIRFTVDDFRFARLGQKVGLVASVDASGRDLAYALVVIQPRPGTAEGFWYIVLPSSPPHLLAQEIVDLDGDGSDEIIARDVVGGYQGASTFPVYWDSILHLSENGTFADVSARFPRYYQSRFMPQVALISGMLSEVSPQPRTGDLRWVLTELEYVRDKFERVINGRTEAGLDPALAWTEDADVRTAMLGIRVLGEIRTPRAISALNLLAASKNQGIAAAAKAELQGLR